MCTVLLPPGGNPIAVNKYINIIVTPAVTHVRQSFIMCEPNVRTDRTVGTFGCVAGSRSANESVAYQGSSWSR